MKTEVSYIVKKLRFLIKKFKLTEYQYNLMEFKSKAWDEASTKVHIVMEDKYKEAKNGKGAVIINFLSSVDYTFIINVEELLKALRFIDSDFECKINIE